MTTGSRTFTGSVDRDYLRDLPRHELPADRRKRRRASAELAGYVAGCTGAALVVACGLVGAAISFATTSWRPLVVGVQVALAGAVLAGLAFLGWMVLAMRRYVRALQRTAGTPLTVTIERDAVVVDTEGTVSRMTGLRSVRRDGPTILIEQSRPDGTSQLATLPASVVPVDALEPLVGRPPRWPDLTHEPHAVGSAQLRHRALSALAGDGSSTSTHHDVVEEGFADGVTIVVRFDPTTERLTWPLYGYSRPLGDPTRVDDLHRVVVLTYPDDEQAVIPHEAMPTPERLALAAAPARPRAHRALRHPDHRPHR